MNLLRAVSRCVAALQGPGGDQHPGQRVFVMYHGVSPQPAFNCVTAETFEAQLDYARSRYAVLPVSRLAAIAASATPSDAPLMALTFDDAYENFWTTAYPILRELKLPAGLAVPTRHVGALNQWDIDHGHPPLRLMDWDQLRELDPMLIEIGSHGTSHRSFGSLTQAEALDELTRSKNELETQLGCRVSWFAFPYGKQGDIPPWADRVLRVAGYRAAFSTKWGRFNLPHDRFAFRRIDVWPSDTLADFANKLCGSYDWLAAKERLGFALRRVLHTTRPMSDARASG
jgi:peptidoglycan/xylan/chitin deacetylase (PgdA/CDA1 family)